MIINRNIGCVNIDIDISQSCDIYFDEEYASLVANDNISDILEMIYSVNKTSHMPLSLFIELTNQCNFSCPFCYINEPGVSKNSVPKFDILKPTIDFLIRKGLFQCTLSGGECLLYPDFTTLYKYLKEHGVLVTVFTNGWLIDDEIISLFCAYPPFKIEISIYGDNDINYSNVVNRKIESEIIFKNIKKLSNRGINVICKTPITKLTEKSYPIIELWCKENNIPYYTGAELMDGYSGESKKKYIASNKIIELEKEKSKVEFINSEEMRILSYSDHSQKFCFDCTAGKTDIFINSLFQLLPCMKAQNYNDWKFDINELGIEVAYNSLVSKMNIEKNKALFGCKGCEHHKVCQECYFTSFDYINILDERSKYCQNLKKYFKHLSEEI